MAGYYSNECDFVKSLSKEFQHSAMSPEDEILAIEEGVRDIENGNVYTEEEIKSETIQLFPFLKNAR